MSSTETFQHYQVLKKPDGALWELGRGAMGVTYKAFDTSLRCHVALKVINTNYLDSEMAAQRFLREARAAAGLSHPNVASVFHLGEEGGNFFYAMEYINGETVESFVKRRGPLPPLIALRIALQVARALRAAARLGLVHRDIKPANLMLVREDEEDTDDNELHLKVIDFGLAKVIRKEGADVSATITVAGFVGTPHFASPEQLEEKDLDSRSDIYSLGVTLWYMLAGKPPFAGSLVQIMSQHLTRRPPFENLTTVPPAVLKVLERMLEKEPQKRQQSPSDLRREIEQAILTLGAVPTAGIGLTETPESQAGSDTENAAPMNTEIITDAGSAIQANLSARQPEPGLILDGRYQLTRRISQSERGTLFQATEVDSRRVVAVKILSPELLAQVATYQKAQEEFVRAAKLSNPSVLGLFAFVRTGAHTFVAYEWVNGFPLVDVLRQRHVLTFNEVVKVLKPVGIAADTLKGIGIDQPEIDSGKILLSVGNGVDAANQIALLSQPLTEWPALQPKIFPLRLRPEAGSSPTWAGQQTIVPVRAAAPSNPALLALLAYDLLGGNAANFHASRRYTPLPTLNEAGNHVLRDVMLDVTGAANRTATEFIDEFVNAVHPSGAGAETAFRQKAAGAPAGIYSGQADVSGTGSLSHASSTTPPPLPPQSLATSYPPPQPPVSQVPPPPPLPALSPAQQPRTVPLFAIFSGVIILLLIVAALGFLAFREVTRKTGKLAGLDPTPSPSLETPVATNTPRPYTPSPTPLVQNTPRPTPQPTATASQPNRAARLANALTEARRMQENRQTADAFAAYVRIAEEFPESDEGLTRIDSYISELRTAPLAGDLEQRRFQQLRPSIERAAKLGSDLAMVFLGEHLITVESGTAAEWFRAAADKGRPEAMAMMGDLYFRGVGVPSDPSQVSRWYQMASDKGYVKAKLSLAECYELGKGGVQRNFDRAFQLLSEALSLEPNNPRALEKVALAYELGHGTNINTQQAFTLMKRASDNGNVNALGNVGAYYMKGLGTTRNERLGASLFKEGAMKNNPFCMFFYARCLEGGIGGIAKNQAEANNYYRGSAERGFLQAKEYCQRNNIRFVPSN